MSRLAQWSAFAVCSAGASYLCGRTMFDKSRDAASDPPLADDISLYVGILVVVLIAWYLVFSPKPIWERLLDSIDLRSGFDDFPWHIPLYVALIGGAVLLGRSFQWVGVVALGLGLEWFTFYLLLRESLAASSARGFVLAFLTVRLASAYAGLRGANAGGWFHPEWPGTVVSLAAVASVLLAVAVSIAIGRGRAASESAPSAYD